MGKFKDSKGNEWDTTFNVGLIEDIKDKAGIDLDLVFNDAKELANLFVVNPRKLVQMLYIICEDQIKERQMSERDFGKLFDRSTLDSATDAIIDSMVNFYPRSSAGRVIAEKLPEFLNKLDKEIATNARKYLEENGHSSNTVTN